MYDECFYVGLGQHGSRKKSGSDNAPSDYKPFQCCPTKLEKSTKVPKMTAQRITHESDKQSDHFKFVTARSAQKTPSSSRGKVPLSKTSTATPTKKATSPQAGGSTGKKTIPSVPLKKDIKSKDLDTNDKNLKGSNKKALANKDGKVKEGMFGIGNYLFW